MFSKLINNIAKFISFLLIEIQICNLRNCYDCICSGFFKCKTAFSPMY